MGTEHWYNLIPYETTDGMIGLPVMPPTRVPAGADTDGFAAAYAALAAAWGVDEEWSNIPGGHVYRRGADGGWWLVDASPSDEEVMRPIVEDAMRAIGMNVPLCPIIPTIRKLGRYHPQVDSVGDGVVLNQWYYDEFGRAVAAGKTSEEFRQEWENGMYVRGVIENGRARITCRSPHMMEEDTRGE